jgi:hypothetical protein
LPERAELGLTAPRGFESPEKFRNLVAAALREREERYASNGRAFLGAARVRAQSTSRGPARGEPRRELKPRVGARDKWKRIEALGRLVAFLTEYRVAWNAWTSGVRDVLFPAGTYALRVAHGVCCEATG